MNVIAMRDELKAVAAQRRDIAADMAAAASEQRWGGLRSIALLLAMSSTLIGLLVVGVLAS
jgi:hypothetical protein